METLSWARRSRGPTVSRLQELLNGEGLGPLAVDGVFGSATHNAVLAFQSAHGLRIDGVVGPQTWAALEAPEGESPSGQAASPAAAARGWSVHVGVNRVDPAHYGTSAPLHGCENDALAMEALAERSGFTTRRRLLTTAATTDGLSAALDEAARALAPGDLLLVTYAGHGAQLPDLETDDDEESDRLDETWCLYDRQLLDDELAAMWGRFRPGVRILLLSDSCHSGTVSRALSREVAVVKELYYASLAPPAAAPGVDGMRAVGDVRAYLATVPLPRGEAAAGGTRDVGAGGALVTRNLPQPVADAVAVHQREVYRTVRRNTPRADRSAIGATVVLLSGCQDNQLSQESGGRGRFSVTLEAVLTEGAVASHPELHRQIVARMPPTQTPAYSVVGAPNPAFEAQAPFTVAAARGGATGGTRDADRAKMAV